jgi:hypothetical protein
MYMPKKLTILGALTVAVMFGAFGVFKDSVSGDAGTHIQHFDTSGAYEIDIAYCYDNAAPYLGDTKDPSGSPVCAAGTSSTAVPRNEAVDSWSIVSIPVGARLALPVTFTPSDGTTEFQSTVLDCDAGDDSVSAPGNECDATTLSGNITARPDLLCTNEPYDVLGDPGGDGTGDSSTWPEGEPQDDWWPEPIFVRTSASAANDGFGVPTAPSPNAYVPGIAPWPKTGGNAFAFQSIDTSVLTRLYLNGVGSGFVIPPTRLQILTGTSSYASQTGLNVSVALLGGNPDSPPEDAFNCLDSPQDSVAYFNFLKTPDADRLIPRWTTFISAADIKDGTQNRILDWSCLAVGTADNSGGDDDDDDDDCLPDADEPAGATLCPDTKGGAGTHPADGDKDCDKDLVPDGIEPFMGSSVSDDDTDNDGADDYDEMYTFTDPTDTDSDDDEQADPQDTLSTAGAPAGSDAPETGTDATTALDDNCPADANGRVADAGNAGQDGQLNTDSMWQYHGHGAGTGDRSNPDEDQQGDACDTDDDNDDLGDATEVLVELVAWGGNGTEPTTICEGPGGGGGPIGLLTKDGDTDSDMVLDGRECQFRSNPIIAVRGTSNSVADGTASCKATIPVDPDGCAQPNNGAGGGAADADSDFLYLPGAALDHGAVEAVFRTMDINTAGGGAQDDDLDNDGPGEGACVNGGVGIADKDSDQDTLGVACGIVTLQDGGEVLYYGTSPASADTDRDGCPDAEEVLDTSGDFRPTAGDQLAWSLEKAPAHLGNATGRIDSDLDGDIDHYHGVNFDFNKSRILESADQLMQANPIGTGAACAATGEAAHSSLKATKGLP